MSPFLRLSCAFLLLISVTLLAASCRTSQEFRSAYDEDQLLAGDFAVNSIDELKTALADQSEPQQELWVSMGVTVRRGEKRVLPSFTAIALYREPDWIKLGFSRMEIGTVYSILIKGDSAELYANREGQLFFGTLDELAEKTPMVAGLPPQELVSAVLMQNELATILASNQPYSVTNKKEHLLIARRHPQTDRQYFWLVRKADALVEEVLIRTPQGQSELRIQYGEFQLVDNEKTQTRLPYPEEMLFHLEEEGLRIEADVKEYRLAPGLTERIFTLPQPKERYRLRDVQFKELE